MSTTIEWTHVPGYRGDVWNPVSGCNKVSPGCKHCYAETMHKRLRAMGVKGYERPFLSGARPVPERLMKPLSTKKPTAWFVNSMSDLFHPDVPNNYIDQVFAVMALCPQHLFLILTKRPKRMHNYFGRGLSRIQTELDLLGEDKNLFDKAVSASVSIGTGDGWPLPNVWLGTSVEDQTRAEERIPYLLRCPAAVRFLSCEPLINSVNLMTWLHIVADRDGLIRAFTDLNWVIAGGESGPKARPMDTDWARSLRDQCAAACVPFFFKQHGAWLHGKRVGKKAAGHLLDGREHFAWPETATRSTQ